MRTTIIFPPDLMRAAKARSAERGESLKALLTRAVEVELGREAVRGADRARVALPMFGAAGAPLVKVSNADLARAIADEDAAAVAASRRIARAGKKVRRKR